MAGRAGGASGPAATAGLRTADSGHRGYCRLARQQSGEETRPPYRDDRAGKT